MFNERDRRCAAVQLKVSTDQSYDNGTIASSLKMQIWMATNTGTCPGWWKQTSCNGYGLWRGFMWGPESQHQSVPGCAEDCGDPLVQNRDELIRDVLLWTPTYGRAKAGRPARTYIQQLYEDTGCSPEDLPEAMNDKEKWREWVRGVRASGTTWWWWWYIYIYIYIVIHRQTVSLNPSPSVWLDT